MLQQAELCNELKAEILRRPIIGSQRLAFAVIHRALKDLVDLEDNVPSAYARIQARQIYFWLVSRDPGVCKFSWWLSLACGCEAKEQAYREEIKKIAQRCYRTIKARTGVDNSLV